MNAKAWDIRLLFVWLASLIANLPYINIYVYVHIYIYMCSIVAVAELGYSVRERTQAEIAPAYARSPGAANDRQHAEVLCMFLQLVQQAVLTCAQL